MVTVNRRFKRIRRNYYTMNESFIDKYIRTKRERQDEPANPKCLFGAPKDEEVDRCITEQNAEQLNTSREILDKYELPTTHDNLLLDASISTTSDTDEGLGSTITTMTDESSSNISYTQSCSSRASANSSYQQFKPRIVTKHNPLPMTNTFSPIDKAAISRELEARSEEYGPTPKRRRRSIITQVTSSTPLNIPENDCELLFLDQSQNDSELISDEEEDRTSTEE